MNANEAQNFGKYELVSRLASGGMAVTYRARLKGAAGVTKSVVIKQILPHFADDPDFVEMFVSEARVVTGLSHGNIAQVFDFGQVNGQYFLAMEFVNGQPLSRVLARARRAGLPGLPAQLALHIASQVADGLDYAHRATDEQHRTLGLVHRDVSPDNVLISYEGEVKVIDFGIAKATSIVAEKTSPGTLKGKYPYFSTEQARGEQDLDARSDIFATGVVLYEMLCGRRPYEGEIFTVLPRIVSGDFERPSKVNPAVTPEVEQAILTAMALDRDARYPTAQAFSDVLRELLYSENPRFSSALVSQLMSYLFADDLSADGRPPELTPSFMELVTSWKTNAPPSNGGAGAQRVPSTGGRRLSNPGVKGQRVVSSVGRNPRQLPTVAAPEPDLDRADTPVEVPSVLPTQLGAETAGTVAQDPVTVLREAQSREKQERAERTQRLVMLLSFPLFGLALLVGVYHFVFSKKEPTGPPTGTVWLTSKPEGAAVTLNGRDLGAVTPVIVRGVILNEANTLGLTLAGHRPWTRRFTPTSGTSAPIHADLEALASVVAEPVKAVAPEPEPEVPGPPKGLEQNEVMYPTRHFTLRPRKNAFPVPEYATASIDLSPGSSYAVYTVGSARLNKGGAGSTGQLVYFLEGDGLKADDTFGLFGRGRKTIRGAKRMHVFALDDDLEDNRGVIKVHLWQSQYVPPRQFSFDAAKDAVVLKPEHQFVLRGLNPQATYLLTMRGDFPELSGALEGRVSNVLCAEHNEKTGRRNHRILEAGKRYQLTGADTFTCTWPDLRVDDNGGAVPVDIVDVTMMSREERNQTLKGSTR